MKENKIAIFEEKFGDESEEDYAIPEIAASIRNKYVCVFEISSNDDESTIGEVEVFIIFSDDKENIQRILCINHMYQTFNWVTDINEVIEFLDVSSSLQVIERYQSFSSI